MVSLYLQLSCCCCSMPAWNPKKDAKCLLSVTPHLLPSDPPSSTALGSQTHAAVPGLPMGVGDPTWSLRSRIPIEPSSRASAKLFNVWFPASLALHRGAKALELSSCKMISTHQGLRDRSREKAADVRPIRHSSGAYTRIKCTPR